MLTIAFSQSGKKRLWFQHRLGLSLPVYPLPIFCPPLHCNLAAQYAESLHKDKEKKSDEPNNIIVHEDLAGFLA